MLPDIPAPALRLGFDPDALRANWQALDRLSGRARAGAAVKADAYGVGARQVVPVLHAAGCHDFFVAHWCEVPDLLDLAAPGSISVLHGPLNDADVAFARASGVKPVINSLEQARRWLAAGGGRCDLMVDTGMNRLGLAMDQIGDAVLAALDVDVLISHLVSADEESDLNAVQCGRWRQACAVIPHARASLANSAGIALGSDYHGDLTRPGIALYGGIPRPEMADMIRQVVRPQAAILQVRTVAAGDTIGYNATFTAPAPMRVGTVALGYADGYLHFWSNIGGFHADGLDLPVLGRISMDMTGIDLTNAPHLDEGDWVTAEYALPEAALATGLSQYELLTVLGRRFGR
ncbi:alanine racemase [Novosphingobium mangrovi (ex Huang et al. 2023)]|uniref:alanine racemase n=1 Tax=Novosphingobium mangrovi (ex Huang et al. 2023) TaxID=2976432 RepID=A0ABT2IAN2_9SPHN|nr:alanine racemase [Novosphingobium mangrovi (ex Huang et al. 2023)]MCT2401874.1 alanine racemase [Novosphingobium mangrovi (ex Huang et al. 2023)]